MEDFHDLKTIAPQLPTVLGSLAAMLIAFVGLLSGTSPSLSLMKAAAAFLVFAGFGLILRHILAETLSEDAADSRTSPHKREGGGLDVIVPGTSVADVLSSQGRSNDSEEAA